MHSGHCLLNTDVNSFGSLWKYGCYLFAGEPIQMETGLHYWVLEMDGNYRPVRGAGCSFCWCQHKSGAGPWHKLTPSPVFRASCEGGELHSAGKRRG